jgi:hypothetical protein
MRVQSAGDALKDGSGGCNQRREAPEADIRNAELSRDNGPEADGPKADAPKADEPKPDAPEADGPTTLAMVFAVMAARSDSRWAARRSLARSSINSAINASLLFSSTASASN